MIHDALGFVRDQLNAVLPRMVSADSASASDLSAPREIVVFPADSSGDAMTFSVNTVTVVLINVEEDHTLRGVEWSEPKPNNQTRNWIADTLRLNLYVLFVARFQDYPTALRHISALIRYFRRWRVFNRDDGLGAHLPFERLDIELCTLPLERQNEIWASLRTTYRPHVLYRIRMVVCPDESLDAAGVVKPVKEIHYQLTKAFDELPPTKVVHDLPPPHSDT